MFKGHQSCEPLTPPTHTGCPWLPPRCQVFTGHQSAVACAAVSYASQAIFSGGEDGIRVWDLGSVVSAKWRHIQTVSGVQSLALSSDCHLLLAGHSNGAISVWDALAVIGAWVRGGGRGYQRVGCGGSDRCVGAVCVCVGGEVWRSQCLVRVCVECGGGKGEGTEVCGTSSSWGTRRAR